MRRFSLFATVMCLIPLGCNGPSGREAASSDSNQEAATAPAPDEADAPTGDLVVGEPISHGNLTIFPVSSRVLRDKDRFITLDEGLKAGTVEIREVGAAQAIDNEEAVDQEAANEEDSSDSAAEGEVAAANQEANEDDDPFGSDEDGDVEDDDPFSSDHDGDIQDDDPFGSDQAGNDVNRLALINRSEKPLYLMPGEIIVGGSQDRTIADELVIQPGDKPVLIDVFCVEHGRWANRGVAQQVAFLRMASAGATLSGSVALPDDEDLQEAAVKANAGKFIASLGSVNKKARMAVQGAANQGEVWENVATTNTISGVLADSGTFSANYYEAQSVKRLEPYIDRLQDPVSGQEKVVGVIVVVDGKIESTDVFESTPLFRKLWPKLLKSYALDAANAADSDDDEKKAEKVATREDAEAFLADVMSAEVEKSDTKGDIAITTRSSEDVVVFSAEEGDAAAGGMMGFGGGMGGAVHSAGFSK